MEWKLVPSAIGELSTEQEHTPETEGAPAEGGRKRPQDKGPEGNIPSSQSPCISDVEVPSPWCMNTPGPWA